MTALDVVRLRVRLGDREVLRGVDFAVGSGHVAAVLGPSGCGKTTLLRAIGGFVTAQAGVVAVGGRRILDVADQVDVAPEQRGVGLVPQEGALFPHLDVAGNVGFGLTAGWGVRRRRNAAVHDRIAECLALVGLAGYERRRVSELSGGQQQRVALARALAPAPGVVLLDEPFSALDAGLREEVREQVRGALAAVGATAVLVTHDQDEALSFADSVAVLTDGVVAMQASPRVIYDLPSEVSVARFVGQSVEVPATVCGDWHGIGEGSGQVATALGLVAATSTTAQSVPAGAVGTLVLRPEQLVLAPAPGELNDPGALAATGRVVGRHYYGHDSLVRVQLTDSSTILARTPGAPLPADQVCVQVTGAGVFFPE